MRSRGARRDPPALFIRDAVLVSHLSQKVLQCQILHLRQVLHLRDEDPVGGAVFRHRLPLDALQYLPESGVDLVGGPVALGHVEVGGVVIPLGLSLTSQRLGLAPVFRLSTGFGLIQIGDQEAGDMGNIVNVSQRTSENGKEDCQGNPESCDDFYSSLGS